MNPDIGINTDPKGVITNGVSDVRAEKSGSCQWKPLSKLLPDEDQEYLLNWLGFVRIDPKTGTASLRIEHRFGYSLIDVDDPVFVMANGNKTVNCDELYRFLNRSVWFDAVWDPSIDGFAIEKMWFDEKWSSESYLYPKMLSFRALEPLDVFLCGEIICIPFSDCAIASVGDVKVLVPLHSLCTETLINKNCSTMRMFVRVGSPVVLKVKLIEGFCCYEAEKCFDFSYGATPKQPYDESWANAWGFAKYKKEGILNRSSLKKLCVVTETSAWAIEKKQVFVDGVAASVPQLNELISKRVSFILKGGEDLLGTVSYAYSGDDVSPLVVLKDKLVVPEGVVTRNEYYDAVVDEFPLPDHAICRIGVVPVLLPLSKLSRGFTPAGLKRGDVISVCVEEKVVGEMTVLVVNDTAPSFGNSVWVNFSGRVIEVTGTRGIIRSDADFDVRFQFCAVQSFKTNRRADDMFVWFEYAKRVIQVGTEMYFSIIAKHEQDNSDDSFHAVDVFVDDEINC